MTQDYKYFTHTERGFLEIPSMDDLCAILKEKFSKLDKQIEFLKKENTELKEENWKDIELQFMKKQHKKMQEDYLRGFPISKDEKEAIDDWIENHEKEKHPRSKYAFPRGGAIGGSYEYRFTPTSIGTFGTVKCTCGEEFTFQERV